MPAPLHIPPTLTKEPAISTSQATSLGLVSVVIMAMAAFLAASLDSTRFLAISLIPAQILSIGSLAPITPVEATSADSTGTPRHSLIVLASKRQASSPSLPVQALATPELITIALAKSSL